MKPASCAGTEHEPRLQPRPFRAWPGIPKNSEGKILALEPSAGIGRAPLAFGSWPELAWTMLDRKSVV
jgi:hypothetical protein